VLGLGLEQAPEVRLQGGLYRSGPTTEMAAEAIAKADEPPTHPRQHAHIARHHGAFLTTSETRLIMLLFAVLLCFDKTCIILFYT
jgi:hypothetical protein